MSTKSLQEHGWGTVAQDPEVYLKGKSNIHEPSPVTVAQIGMPQTELVRKVQEYAKKELREETYNHSMRVYYYAHAMLEQQFLEWHISDETLIIASLLHDIGTTKKNMSATQMSFEYYGGFLAHSLLTKDLNAPVSMAESVTECIIRHQELAKIGNTTTCGHIIQLATVFDNVGGNPGLIHKGTIENVVEAYPRKGWNGCFANTIREEIAQKPWAHSTTLGPEFPEASENNKLMQPYD